MLCPYCKSENTSVVDTRPLKTANITRRRHICHVCDTRFTTYELVREEFTEYVNGIKQFIREDLTNVINEGIDNIMFPLVDRK